MSHARTPPSAGIPAPGYGPPAPPGRPRRRRRRTLIVVVTVAALVVVLGGGAAGYLLTRTKGSPQQTAASYLRGWQRGDYPAMDKVSVNVPRGGLAGPLRQYAAQLGLRSLHTRLGPVTSSGGTARAQFTAAVTHGQRAHLDLPRPAQPGGPEPAAGG